MRKDNSMMTPGNTATIPGISLTHEQRTKIKSLVDSNRLQEAQEIILGILDENYGKYNIYEASPRVGDEDKDKD